MQGRLLSCAQGALPEVLAEEIERVVGPGAGCAVGFWCERLILGDDDFEGLRAGDKAFLAIDEALVKPAAGWKEAAVAEGVENGVMPGGWGYRMDLSVYGDGGCDDHLDSSVCAGDGVVLDRIRAFVRVPEQCR